MNHPPLWLRSTLVVMLLLITACQPIQPEAAQSTTQTTDPQIQNAMSAAPPAIAQEATILGWPNEEGGEMVVLREGSNGWTCIADWPASPGNDPSCNDPVWMAWNDAYAKGEEPEITGPGLAYMLQGGSDPSNTDPMATEPAPGEDWVATPPHMMILLPDGFDAANFTTDHHSGYPYIMWDGTPYEHLMVPIVGATPVEMGNADAQVANILAAAPAVVALNATILGEPTTAGGDMVVLQEGDNGWICYDDRSVSPGNAPACYDEQWNVFNEAYMAGEAPVLTAPGIGYMLQGGSDESNTDPLATGPAPGEEWITTPSHIMLLLPDGFDAANFTTDHHSGYPYIMWDGTPYEHLMVPVNSEETEMGM
ncbi:MAG: hypothetical protein R3E79_57450 [Caldilineaceae bacterium]